MRDILISTNYTHTHKRMTRRETEIKDRQHSTNQDLCQVVSTNACANAASFHFTYVQIINTHHSIDEHLSNARIHKIHAVCLLTSFEQHLLLCVCGGVCVSQSLVSYCSATVEFGMTGIWCDDRSGFIIQCVLFVMESACLHIAWLCGA
jgi:hypothetical protein